MAYQNKSPLKIFEKRERWRIQGLPKFFGYPLLSQELVKLRTSNFVGTFIESIGTKAHENVGNIGRGRSQAVAKIFMAPICRAHCAVIFAIAQLFCLVCCQRPGHETFFLKMWRQYNDPIRYRPTCEIRENALFATLRPIFAISLADVDAVKIIL